jgi:vacuolar-type H+-ATPase subunit E/Vma4
MGLMDKVNKLKDEAQELAEEHRSEIEKALDTAKEHLPGKSAKAETDQQRSGGAS